MEYIIKGQIAKYRKGYHLSEELENLGYVLVKENRHPKGWSLVRKLDIPLEFVTLVWSPNLKRLDNYISRHITILRGANS
jgi:hypothetical protein